MRWSAILVTGGLIGTVEALIAVSFAGLVFHGPLGQYLDVGIGITLFGAVVILAVTALAASIPGMVGSVQDVTAAVLALVTAGVAAGMATTDPSLLPTVLVAIVTTTVLTGVILWALGKLRLGRAVRFVPYPVIGGFLAGTGWLLLTGGIGLSRGGGSFFAQLAPAVALALALFVGIRLGAGSTLIPVLCVVSAAIFYAVAALGPGLSALAADGWLLGPFPEGALWPPADVGWSNLDVGAVVGEAPNMLAVAGLAALALLLNVTGVELATGQSADLDRELRMTGMANVLVASGGGLPGFQALSLSNLAYRAGMTSPAVGVVAALVVGSVLVAGGSLLAQIPRFVFGGVLIFIGASFLWEWLIDGWSRLVRSDYLVVVLIVVVVATVGFLQGIALGILVTTLLFLITYGRTDVVKHVLTGDIHPSKVDRPLAEVAALRRHGAAITVYELAGYLFFGSADRLYERLRSRLQSHGADGPSFVVLDLRGVTGLDSSATLSLRKAIQIAPRHDATIVLTGLTSRTRAVLERDGLLEEAGLHVESELDRAIQWCEDRLLTELAPAIEDEPADLRSRLADEIGDPDLMHRLLSYLERIEVPAGGAVIEQGQREPHLYFLEEGILSVELRGADGARSRLRRMLPGSVVGEVGVYTGSVRTASVVAETDSVLERLSAEAFARLEQEDPAAAAALHRLLARHLAARLTATLATIEAFSR